MNPTSRKSMRACALALFLAAAAAGSARATAPNLMTYQGRLKESGLPVTAVRSVDIQICNAFTGGVCTTTGAQNVAVANGLFRTTFTVPSGITLETGSWFLEVHVGASAFGPRETLSANAYSIYASSASTLIVNPGDPAVFITPTVSIAGNGSIGGNSFSVGGSTFVVSGGNVGVGNPSPASALDVKGNMTLGGTSGNLTLNGTVGHIRAGGSTPSVGACGTAPSVAGSDSVGRITLGTGVGASCTLVFGTAWSPNFPVCHFTNEKGTAQAYTISAVSGSLVTFQGTTALVAGDVINYICLSY